MSLAPAFLSEMVTEFISAGPEETFATIRQFFELPTEDKVEASWNRSPAARGYEPFSESKVALKTDLDLRESFCIGDDFLDEEVSRQKPFEMGAERPRLTLLAFGSNTSRAKFPSAPRPKTCGRQSSQSSEKHFTPTTMLLSRSGGPFFTSSPLPLASRRRRSTTRTSSPSSACARCTILLSLQRMGISVWVLIPMRAVSFLSVN